MYIHRLNKPIFDLPSNHSARRFLEAFIACRNDCVGREHDGIDQEWFSASTNRNYTFSSFTYEWLAFDVELDGWLGGEVELTESERQMLEMIPKMETLTFECQAAARRDNNPTVIQMCEQVLEMLRMWKDCITSRIGGLERKGG